MSARRRPVRHPDGGPGRPPGLRILVVSDQPAQPGAGHTGVLEDLLDHLAERHGEVTVVDPTARPSAAYLARRLHHDLRSRAYWRVGPLSLARPRPGSRRLAGHLKRALRPSTARPWGAADAPEVAHVGRYVTPDEETWLARRIDEVDPDVVIFNTLFMIPTTAPDAAARRGPARFVLTHDVMSDRAAGFARFGFEVRPPDLADPEVERRRLALGGTLIAISWDDAEAFRRLLPTAEVIVVPVAMSGSPRAGGRPPGKRCVFVGSASAHNVDGLRWFLEASWPAVRALVPDAELHVVGAVGSSVPGGLAGVAVDGMVRDLSDAYGASAVAVVPLRIGSGMKVKLVEAIVHGVPAVTTGVGAQGLTSLDPRPFAVADDPGDFAREIASLLTDEDRWRSLHEAATTTAPRFDRSRSYAELDARLAALVDPPDR